MISNVIEKQTRKQIYDYLVKNELLKVYQTDLILDNLYQLIIPDPEIFLVKINCSFFSEALVYWFKTYIAEKSKVILKFTKRHFSNAGVVNCGITQRSVKDRYFSY